MDTLQRVIYELMKSNAAFGNLDEDDRFYASDTPEGVRNIFRISPVLEEVTAENGIFLKIGLNVYVIYEEIEKLFDELLGELSFSGVSGTLDLMNWVPEEYLYLGYKYLINISNELEKKKSIDELIALYYQWIEPVRKKMHSPRCLMDFDFHPKPKGESIGWELRRLAYLYLYERAMLKPYIENLNERLLIHIKEIDRAEAELKEGDFNFWLGKEKKLVNLTIHTHRQWVTKMKNLLAVLEKV